MTSTNPKSIPIDLKLDTDEMNICRNLFRALVSYLENLNNMILEDKPIRVGLVRQNPSQPISLPRP